MVISATIGLTLLNPIPFFQEPPTESVQYIEKYLQTSRIPGIVCLYKQGDSAPLTIATGFSNIEPKTSINPTQLFDSGSIGKMFTTVVTLKLAEENKLKLTDQLGQYVSEVPDSWKTATVSQLLAHTAGLPEYVLYDGIQLTQDFELPKYFEVMADKPIDFAPGTEFQYSNSNFFMLKLIAEKASKKSFTELLITYVFSPADMTETGPLLAPDVLEKRKATGYWISQNVDPIGPAGKSPDLGSGGHFTTVQDLTKFAQSLFKGTLLSKESLTKMTTPAPLPKGRKSGYGYGLFIRNVNGTTIWSHGGNSVGYAGSITYIPSKDTTIVLLGNAYQMSGDSVALGLARILYPELNPKPFTEQSDPNIEQSKRLVSVLQELAARKIDGDLVSSEMRARLARPRGQMTLQNFSTLASAEYDAFMGSEKMEPDTIIRIRVIHGERKSIAHFTVDAEGKVYGVSLSPVQ